jgi:hypothetical protein
MARYDKDTADFMEKVADQSFFNLPKKKEERKDAIEDITRRSMMVAKGIAGGPQSAIRALSSAATGTALDKMASMSPESVYSYLNDKYGRKWWDWEPETIWTTLKKDEGLAASEEIKNMIQALQVVLNTNYAHEMWNVFENVGQAFNNNIVSFGMIQPLELTEAALTLRVLRAIRPKQEFEADICAYIAASAKESGVVYLPKDLFLEGCQETLDELNNDIELRNEVADLWSGKRARSASPEADVQLVRLDEIHNYIN